jgi:hypothetical protein
MCIPPNEGRRNSRYCVFAVGIFFKVPCYTQRAITTRDMELCATNGKFLHAFCGPL